MEQPEKGEFLFVLGCGRSGTHWLGHVLECYPDIRITIEKNPQFNLVQSMVTNIELVESRFPSLKQAYLLERSATSQRIYADKTHPNLFMAEILVNHFPNAKFMGIQRSSLGTISSMLNHQGVLQWHKSWRQYPIPNYFLGISPELAKVYDRLSMPQRCALRWAAHRNHMNRLKTILGERLLVIDYESMQQNFDTHITQINQFLDVKPDFDTLPRPREASLGKWKKVLTEHDITQISQITGEKTEALMAL